MAWTALTAITAGTEILVNNALLDGIVGNILASGVNATREPGDIIYALDANKFREDDNSVIGRLAIADGQVGNFVSARNTGGEQKLVWTGGVAALSYRDYLANQTIFEANFDGDANVSKTAGLNFIEAFARDGSQLLIGAITDLDTTSRLLTSDLGDFSPRVQRYVPESLEGELLTVTNSSILNVVSRANGRLEWDIPSGSRYRIGFVYFGSPDGVSESYILDIEDGMLLPDFEPFVFPGSSYNNVATIDVARNWSISLGDIETVSTTARMRLRGYSHTPSLNEVTGVTGTGDRTSIGLQWNDVFNADRYRIEVTDSSDSVDETQTSANNTATVTGLPTDAIYEVRVRAEGQGALYGQWSDSLRIATETPTLDRVSGLSLLVVGTGQITINWNSVTSATSYVIQWRDSGQSFSTARQATSNSTQYILTSLSANTTYYVQVKARANNFHDGDWSFEDNATTERLRLNTPNPPSLSVLGSSSIRATWSSVPNASSYRVHWRELGGSTQTNDTTSTSFTLSGLRANTTHYVAIQALTTNPNFQNSNVSNESSAMTSPAALGRPNLSLSSADDDSISVNWSSVTNAQTYELQWRSSSQSYSSSRQTNTSSTSRTITGLFDDTLYYIRVRATASGFASSSYDEISVRTDETVLPVLGQVMLAGNGTITQTSASIIWSPVTNASSYTIQWRSSGQSYSTSRQATDSSSPYSLSGLVADTDYFVRIKATASGYTDGAYSDEHSFSTSPIGLGPYPSNTQVLFFMTYSALLNNGILVLVNNFVEDATGVEIQWRRNDEAYSSIRRREIFTTFYPNSPFQGGYTVSAFLAQGTSDHIRSNTLYYIRIRGIASGENPGPWFDLPGYTTGTYSTSSTVTVAPFVGSSIVASHAQQAGIRVGWVTSAPYVYLLVRRAPSNFFVYLNIVQSSPFVIPLHFFQPYGNYHIFLSTYSSTVQRHILGDNDTISGTYIISATSIVDITPESTRNETGEDFLEASNDYTRSIEPRVVGERNSIYGFFGAYVIDDHDVTLEVPQQPRNISLSRVDSTTMDANWNNVSNANEYEVRYRNAYVDNGSGSRNWRSPAGSITASQVQIEDAAMVVAILSDTNGSTYDFGFWVEVQVRAVNTDVDDTRFRYSPWSVSRFIKLAAT